MWALPLKLCGKEMLIPSITDTVFLLTRAPELYKDYQDISSIDASKADVWSLGVLTYSVSVNVKTNSIDD